MAVYQTNTFICEVCGKIISNTEVVFPHTDPVVNPPEGWGFVDLRGDEVFSCGDCVCMVGLNMVV